IQQLFQMKLQGAGVPFIARKLNDTATWLPPKSRPNQEKQSWQYSYVQMILRNTATIGYYQPKKGRKPAGDPIANYFPGIISPAIFHAVQQQLDATEWERVVITRDGKRKTIKVPKNGGCRNRARNLFRYMAKCAYCGGPMAFVDKSKTSSKGTWLIC